MVTKPTLKFLADLKRNNTREWFSANRPRYEAARERYRPFDALVDEDPSARTSIAELCADAARRGRPAYCVINNKAEGSAPLSAFRLAAEILDRLA